MEQIMPRFRRSQRREKDAAAIVGSLSYLVPGDGKPCSYAFEPPEGVPWENCAYEWRPVPIEDGRHAPGKASLQREGFELWDAPTEVEDFLDEEEVRSVYYPECAELALAATGASRAYVFDHLVRRREADRPPLNFGRGSRGKVASANGRIHNDYTEASGRRRLELVVQDAHTRRHVRRFSIVNVWRSIRGPVLDTPLAVCDARTVHPSDLVPSEVRYRNRTGEIYFVAYSPRHRWTYYSAMDRHEALVFKQYDSQADVSRFTPHAAFDHPHTPADAPLRESIELRCLVTYD